VRKVLVVAHNFPPTGGAGVQRSVKFVKYLPSLGWEPIVLTTARRTLPAKDPSLLRDLSDKTRIIRTFTPEPMSKVWGEDSLWSYFLWGLTMLVSIPDPGIWWVPWAAWHGYRQLQSEAVDVIYATGPPFSSHFVGAVLKKLTRIPLIIEFRDAWTLEPNYGARRLLLRWHAPFERLMQDGLVKYADKVVFVTEGMRKDFAREYSKENAFATIRNAFDAEDFVQPGKHLSKDRFNIVYTGMAVVGEPSHNPDTFFESVKKAVEMDDGLRRDLCVTFVGNMDPQSKALISELGIAPWVKAVPYCPHLESIQYLLEADVLLLIVKEHGSIVTGKIFEYIGARKPVLALVVPDGEAAWLLQKAGSGVLADWNDPTDIASKIITLYHKWQERDLTVSVDSAFIATLTRKNMTRLLVNVLDGVTTATSVVGRTKVLESNGR
jgi:glycosyltransferase involved in cell wall biosynthesis